LFRISVCNTYLFVYLYGYPQAVEVHYFNFHITQIYNKATIGIKGMFVYILFFIVFHKAQPKKKALHRCIASLIDGTSISAVLLRVIISQDRWTFQIYLTIPAEYVQVWTRHTLIAVSDDYIKVSVVSKIQAFSNQY
jgi:hypothetical protein